MQGPEMHICEIKGYCECTKVMNICFVTILLRCWLGLLELDSSVLCYIKAN